MDPSKNENIVKIIFSTLAIFYHGSYSSLNVMTQSV